MTLYKEALYELRKPWYDGDELLEDAFQAWEESGGGATNDSG